MNQIIDNMKKIFNTNNSRKRNIENLIIFLVGLIIIIIATGYIFNKEDKTVVSTNSIEIFDPNVFENKLNKILSNIEGAGNVAVMVSYKTGVENIPLKYNIDPDDKTRKSYAVPYKQPRPRNEYQAADKNYRVHKDDLPTINKLKNKKSR